MAILDEVSGYEFEDIIEDVFRNLGYENVRQSRRTGDEGRDILMEERVNGQRQAVVVECKHTDSVGRPVVQKLHSAVATYDYDGPKRGMVVTTGQFTGPAVEYADSLRESDDPHQIELTDGTDLREIADDVGLDLYNGRIEILCDQTLRPYDPTRGVDGPVRDAFSDVENIHAQDIPEPTIHASFRPFLRVQAQVDATFETSVGVIYSVDEHETLVVRAERGGPQIPTADIRNLLDSNVHQSVELDEEAFEETFSDITVKRYGQTETEYKDWAVDRLRRDYTTTVQYTGDNNVDYSKECEPNRSDISVHAITPTYLPSVRASTDFGNYRYSYEYYAAGPSRTVTEDGIHQCVQCGDTESSTYTHCENCHSINCPSHTKTERLTGEPVCTGCAVTERFFLKTKFFYDEANLDTFRDEYEAMPIHKKATENRPLVATVAVTLLVAVFSLLIAGGVI